MKYRFFILLCIVITLEAYSVTSPADRLARLLETADSLHGAGRSDSAVIVGESAVALAHEIGDPTAIVGAHSSTGVYLRSVGRIEDALKSYDAALDIVTSGQFRENPSEDDIEEIASLYINLAVLNLDMQHKDEAITNASLSADWIARSEDSALKSTIYGVVGSVLTACGELDKAMYYQDLAYSNALKSDDREAAFRSAAYTMLIADRLADKDSASLWRSKCRELLPEIESTMARLVYYQAECSICLKNNDRRGALKWFDEILESEGIDNLPFVKFDCYNNKHIAQAELGDYKDAYATLLKSNELRDSLWEREKAESLRELTVKYETKETQLALAQSESRRSRTLMWLFAAIGMLLLAVAGFVIYAAWQRGLRMKKEMEFAKLRADITRRLTEQYVEGLETERSRMSRELHDGVCNDLLAIQMNIKQGKSLDSTAGLIEACRESVRRISHELMPPEFSYASLDEVLRYYVAGQQDACGEKIKFNYTSEISDAYWTDIPDSYALEVYRIIQEAVGNAVKHSGATAISVNLHISGKTLEATVSDNGRFRSSGRRGLGTDSIRRRAGSINGQAETFVSPEGGTVVKLRALL